MKSPMSAPAFALIIGLLYTGLGSLGLLSALVMPAPDSPASFGYLFSLFAVNWAMNGAHFLVGLWGLMAWSGFLSAVTYARSISVLLGLMAVVGLFAGLNAIFSALPLHGYNVWLHALTAIAAAYFGFRSRARLAMTRKQRRHSSPDRRHEAQRVALERRRRVYDRRHRGTLAAG